MRCGTRDSMLGMRGGFLRTNPYKDRMLHDPSYEPFWTMAEELDFSIVFHEGSNSNMPTVGVDRFEDRAARHMDLPRLKERACIREASRQPAVRGRHRPGCARSGMKTRCSFRRSSHPYGRGPAGQSGGNQNEKVRDAASE